MFTFSNRGKSNPLIRRPKSIETKPFQGELGFGKNVTTEGRMMNADGSFNVKRHGGGIWDDAYFRLISMPLHHFLSLTVAAYVALNIFFACLYLLAGLDQLNGMENQSWWTDFLTAFYFSTQTITTVGYGHIYPIGTAANIIASFESFCGLLSFALISGLLYGRFSRSHARIVFSRNLLVSPYQEGSAFMFRMANVRKSELIETEVNVMLAINQSVETGEVVRRFYQLDLEIPRISFFALSWTIVHPMNEKSPLWGLTRDDLINARAEFLVLVKGTDEANQQIVHARRSFIAEDIIWDARFAPVIMRDDKGVPQVLTHMIGAYENLQGS